MFVYGMDPQAALDAPRFLVGSGHVSPLGDVNLEQGIDESVAQDLRELGHSVKGSVGGFSRSMFGRGQIATRKKFWCKDDQDTASLWAASDPRGDGVALGY